MNKLVVFLIFVATACGARGEGNEQNAESPRQKRLLFYDEEGNLVKTYSPSRYDYIQNTEKVQFPFAKFWNPFYNFMKPSYGSTMFMIPISEAVMRHLYTDPTYYNKLLNIPRKEQVLGPDARCNGKRTQIPADNCQNFLNCWDGWAMEQECPGDLMFSREGFCDFRRNVDCTRREPSPSPPQSPSPQKPSVVSQNPPVVVQPPTSAGPQCDRDGETWRDQHDCGIFYVCVDRAPVKLRCPDGLFYNLENRVCDYKERVNCRSNINLQEQGEPSIPQSPSPPKPQETPVVPAIPENPPAAVQLPTTIGHECDQSEAWRDAEDCTVFYVCVHRAPVRFQCPPSLAYSVENQLCDYKEHVNCTNRQAPTIEQASHSTVSTPALEAAKLPFSFPGVVAPMSPYFVNKIPDGKTFITSNAVHNTQSWSSSHVAISRQDALRQLKLSGIANISS